MLTRSHPDRRGIAAASYSTTELLPWVPRMLLPMHNPLFKLLGKEQADTLQHLYGATSPEVLQVIPV